MKNTSPKNVTIVVKTDWDCEMRIVRDSFGEGMEGNFWDFHNGCHGINKFGRFSNSDELVEKMAKFYKKKGYIVEIQEEEYSYYDS